MFLVQEVQAISLEKNENLTPQGGRTLRNIFKIHEGPSESQKQVYSGKTENKGPQRLATQATQLQNEGAGDVASPKAS